jgi:hypothetical protein
MSRTPLVIGIAAVGVLAVAAVAVPRIASVVGTTDTTGTATSTAVISQHDLVEHSREVSRSVDSARLAAATERRLSHEAKLRAATIGATAVTVVRVPSTQAQQVGGLHGTYAYRPGTLVALGLPSTLRQQVGGMAPTFPYSPSLSGVHTRWTDTFVPPFRDPAWKAAIARHYAGSFSTPEPHSFH